MKTYSFSITLAGVPTLTDDVSERIFAAGCDDATPVSGDGITSIGFDRQSKSLESAIASAADQIRQAGYNVGQVTIENEDLAVLGAAS